MSHSQQVATQNDKSTSTLASFARKLPDRNRGANMGRAAKGSVKVEADRGWLRLVWSWGGRRFRMAVGLPDDAMNRAIAQRRAALIEADIKAERFDQTLERYRQQAEGGDRLSVVDLFERWIAHKSRQVEPQSLVKHRAFIGHLRQFFRGRNADLISEDEAFKFRDHLLKKNAPITVRERIGWLRSCWQWALKRRLFSGGNPWEDVRVKVAAKQPEPFTRQEVAKILKAFEAPEFCHYRDFAEFLLSVGCRPGEAIGLRWRHLKDDCSGIWIGESLGREKRQKPTKNNKSRSFDLTPRLQRVLEARKPEKPDPNGLVFMSVEGHQIDDKNFCRRYWKRALEAAGVPYRRPYNSRHSFISISVDQGAHPIDISEISGHSPETLYRNYLGSVRGRVKLPDLLGD